MMHSIMSLIRETLSSNHSSTESKPETHGATALKHEGSDFDAALSQVPPAGTCNSMARIKTKTSNANAQDGDADDAPDSTRCMSPDDFMAWAFNAKSATQTIPSPDLAVASSQTMPKMNAVNPNELPSKSSIIAADMHDISDEPMAPSDHEIRPQASILEPAPATERVSIGKLARSKNATEVPPPSVLPMIDADDVMPTTARYDATPAERQQATNSLLAAQMAPMAQRTDIHELPTRPELRAHNAAARNESAKSDHPEIWISTLTAEPPTPMPPLAHGATHDTVAMPRVEMPKSDGRNASTEARQEAVTQAVNQLTLKKAAGGELDIPELGKVKVGAETIGAEVDVRIQAERQETRSLVASHAHEIALDARSARIPVNGVRVDGASTSRTQMSFGSSQDAPHQQRDSQRNDDEAKKAAFWMPYAKRARFVL